MNKVYGVVVVLIIALGGWYWYSSSQAPASDTADTLPPTDTAAPTSTGTSTESAIVATTTTKTVTVTYSATGFSPKTITINKGDTVTFVNEKDGRMWVASDLHPSHEGYDGTSRSEHCPDTTGTVFDQCTASASYTFTFNKVGTWAYHNHSAAADVGTVIVK